jgi:hypothetical protein
MAFTLISGARHSLHPPKRGGPLTTPQASLHATDRSVALPTGAFDTGLRPDPFPSRAASLLPGLLAVTRTGLPPASNDELTNQRSPIQGHLQFCWAHERSGLVARCHGLAGVDEVGAVAEEADQQIVANHLQDSQRPVETALGPAASLPGLESRRSGGNPYLIIPSKRKATSSPLHS